MKGHFGHQRVWIQTGTLLPRKLKDRLYLFSFSTEIVVQLTHGLYGLVNISFIDIFFKYTVYYFCKI